MTLPPWRSTVDVVTTCAILLTCGVLVWANRDKLWTEPVTVHMPSEPVSLDGSPIRGDHSAELVMIIYTDYQCPFCRRFERETLPVLEERYVQTRRLRLAVRHNPLESIHPFAADAAVAATCAGRQNSFWRFHDRLFDSSPRLDETLIRAIADEIGLNLEDFAACRVGDAVDAVRADAAGAAALGLRSTPAFLIGRVQADGRVDVAAIIKGAQPLDEFQRVIDGLLPDSTVSRQGLTGAVGATATVLFALLGMRRARGARSYQRAATGGLHYINE